MVIWPDNDEAGQGYGDRITEALNVLGTRVSKVDVSALGLGEKEGFSDWLAKNPGAGATEVSALIPKLLTTDELLDRCRR